MGAKISKGIDCISIISFEWNFSKNVRQPLLLDSTLLGSLDFLYCEFSPYTAFTINLMIELFVANFYHHHISNYSPPKPHKPQPQKPQPCAPSSPPPNSSSSPSSPSSPPKATTCSPTTSKTPAAPRTSPPAATKPKPFPPPIATNACPSPTL